MQLPIIVTKYTFCDTVVFDYIPFPSLIHTTGMTHFLGLLQKNKHPVANVSNVHS